MHRILFLLYHGQGHFNACLRPAKVLRQNYEVIFSGHAFFQRHLEEQDFRYYPLKSVPFALGFENWVNTIEHKKFIYWHSLKDRWNDRLYKVRETELLEMIQAIKPDYLLIDSWQSTDFIVLFPYLKTRGIKIGFIQTMLPTVISSEIPPINSEVLPDDKLAVKKAHRQFHWKQLKSSVLQKIKYFGRDDTQLIKKRIRLNNISKKYLSSKKSLFTLFFEQIPELVLAPKEFDFIAIPPAREHHYVGFMPDSTRLEHGEASYAASRNQIQTKLKDRGAHLIYCSFGSQAQDEIEIILKFIQLLVKVVSRMEHVLVISVNSDRIIDQFKILPPFIFIHNNVPQLQVLAQASIMITHGGLNSIKEAVYAEVPLLVYPTNPKTDHAGNAARIVFRKLGLRGSLVNDSEKEIEQKIKQLLSDKSFIKNIKQLKAIDESYTDENFLNIIQTIPPVA
jgi:zeaxanthin glucosyltransferase